MGVRLDEEETVIRDTVKKSKHNKKNRMNNLKENSFTWSGGAEQRKMKNKRRGNCDIEFDSALDEVENRKGCAEVNGDLQKETDQKKKKKKKKKNEIGIRKLVSGEDEDAEVQMEGEDKNHKSSGKEDISKLKDGEEGSKEKKNSQDGKDAGKMREENVGDNGGEVEKKRKKEKKKGILDAEIVTEELGNRETGAAIPYRPFRAIYYRAHILFERGETCKWTQEDYEFIKKVQKKHGNNWKVIVDELGKHRFHVKDTWRRIKLASMKKRHWSQEEYQTLFDLVNTDLPMKASEEKKSKHGMLRDNICWGAISDKLSTHTNQTCYRKWYMQLTSSMIEERLWDDVDVYRLLDAPFNLDACCVEDVDWDSLLEHWSGEVCWKRWDKMVRHIGLHKSFSEQVDILAKRYCPALVEAREEWDSKPRVD
ncbi:hypothetical protein LguiA_021168 [Lonicera macranthoides]